MYDKITRAGVKKRLVQSTEPPLHAARRASSKIKEDQHSGELLVELTGKTVFGAQNTLIERQI